VRAFRGRHLSVVGDSNVRTLHHALAAWLLALGSRAAVDAAARERLAAHAGPGAPALTSEAALALLTADCPATLPPEYAGTRCAYASAGGTFCKREGGGCAPFVEAGGVGVSFKFGHGAVYPDQPLFGLEVLRGLEAAAAAASQGSFGRAHVVVVNGGLHYLHLFPSRPFEGRLGAMLGSYLKHVEAALAVLRKHVGPEGLVIWKTVSDVCDEKYDKEYSAVLRIYRNTSREKAVLAKSKPHRPDRGRQ
jgi:hypothetical protein